MPQPKNILSVLADNSALSEAVKLLVTKQFEKPPTITPETSDLVLGQFLRAHITGLEAIDAAWKELAQYKSIPDRPERVNSAR